MGFVTISGAASAAFSGSGSLAGWATESGAVTVCRAGEDAPAAGVGVTIGAEAAVEAVTPSRGLGPVEAEVPAVLGRVLVVCEWVVDILPEAAAPLEPTGLRCAGLAGSFLGTVGLVAGVCSADFSAGGSVAAEGLLAPDLASAAVVLAVRMVLEAAAIGFAAWGLAGVGCSTTWLPTS